MSSQAILLVVLAMLAVLLCWIVMTVSRLDRLDVRVVAARSALDAQLAQRARVARMIAESPQINLNGSAEQLGRAAQEALDAGEVHQEAAENALGHMLRIVGPDLGDLPQSLRADLESSSAKVLLARRFYNDAVRDNRQLRGQGLPRLFRLAARRPMPTHFDIDDRLVDATGPRTEQS